MNVYAYVNGNVVNLVDPMGLAGDWFGIKSFLNWPAGGSNWQSHYLQAKRAASKRMGERKAHQFARNYASRLEGRDNDVDPEGFWRIQTVSYTGKESFERQQQATELVESFDQVTTKGLIAADQNVISTGAIAATVGSTESVAVGAALTEHFIVEPAVGLYGFGENTRNAFLVEGEFLDRLALASNDIGTVGDVILTLLGIRLQLAKLRAADEFSDVSFANRGEPEYHAKYREAIGDEGQFLDDLIAMAEDEQRKHRRRVFYPSQWEENLAYRQTMELEGNARRVHFFYSGPHILDSWLRCDHVTLKRQ